MQARGPLMIEHRLIERMINLMREAKKQIDERRGVNPLLIDSVVDFIKVYADRTHHGKEEDLLFATLDKKNLTPEDAALMKRLIAEHVYARGVTKTLADANDAYRDADYSSLSQISASLGTLADFYPKHILMEDRVFFPAMRNYLSEEEDHALLASFWEFDRRMIHEKYKGVLEGLMQSEFGISPIK